MVLSLVICFSTCETEREREEEKQTHDRNGPMEGMECPAASAAVSSLSMDPGCCVCRRLFIDDQVLMELMELQGMMKVQSEDKCNG